MHSGCDADRRGPRVTVCATVWRDIAGEVIGIRRRGGDAAVWPATPSRASAYLPPIQSSGVCISATRIGHRHQFQMYFIVSGLFIVHDEMVKDCALLS